MKYFQGMGVDQKAYEQAIEWLGRDPIGITWVDVRRPDKRPLIHTRRCRQWKLREMVAARLAARELERRDKTALFRSGLFLSSLTLPVVFRGRFCHASGLCCVTVEYCTVATQEIGRPEMHENRVVCVRVSLSARPNWSLEKEWTTRLWMRQWNGRRGMRKSPCTVGVGPFEAARHSRAETIQLPRTRHRRTRRPLVRSQPC